MRGSLRSDRQNGRVLVWVDEGRPEGGREAQVDREALLEAKEETIRTPREQLEAERRANEENRRLLTALIQRVPELWRPRSNRQRPLRGASRPPKSPRRPRGAGATPRDGGPQNGSERRSWWQRMFGV